VNGGDQALANRRIELIKNIPVLPAIKEVTNLAMKYFDLLKVPEKSRLDAFHLAITVVHKIDYLLTWNCKHMAHGEIRRLINDFNRANNLFEPVILTPYELMRRD
jgi:hypothetical protein